MNAAAKAQAADMLGFLADAVAMTPRRELPADRLGIANERGQSSLMSLKPGTIGSEQFLISVKLCAIGIDQFARQAIFVLGHLAALVGVGLEVCDLLQHGQNRGADLIDPLPVAIGLVDGIGVHGGIHGPAGQGFGCAGVRHQPFDYLIHGRGFAHNRGRLRKSFKGEQKLQFFYAGKVGDTICDHPFPFTDRKGMAKALGLGEAQLKGAKDDHDRLSDKALKALGEYLGFDPGWIEFRAGEPQEFARRYNAENCCELKVSRQEPATFERRADVLLARGPRQLPERSKTHGLASVEIDGHQFGRGTADIEVVISCGTPIVSGRTISIQNAQLELDCGSALLSEHSYRHWLKQEKLEVKNNSKANIAVKYGGGTRERPNWWLSAEKGGIGNLELEPGFVALASVAPGDRITVRLGTWLMDLQEVQKDGDLDGAEFVPGVIAIRRDGANSRLTSSELSALKRNLIGALGKSEDSK